MTLLVDFIIYFKIFYLESAVTTRTKTSTKTTTKTTTRKITTTPNKCKNGYYGPTCQYKILNSTIFKNSTILTNELSLKLVNLTGIKSNYSLIYQASIHSFRSSSFHSKCDNISNTLTVIKSKKFIFGGFTTAKWNMNKYDSNAFIFSLVNAYNIPVKMSIIYPEYAIYSTIDSGPLFGAGYDISLPNNSNITFGYSYINCYHLPSFVKDRSTFLAGSFEFLTDQIEVYALNGKLCFENYRNKKAF